MPLNDKLRFRFLHPARMFWSVRVFCNDWWFSRPVGSLIRGLPAVAVLVAVAALLCLGAARHPRQLVQRYEAAAAAAIEREDFETAEICLRKLASLEPVNRRHRFRLGLLAARQDDLPRARRIIQRLAPLDQTGYAPAHHWLALDLVKSETPLDQDRAKVAQLHLLRAVEAEPGHLDAHALLGQLLMRERRYDRAAAHIAKVVQRRPGARLPLANVYALLGDQERAQRQGELAVRHFEALVAVDADNDQARIRCAGAYLLLKQYRAAERTLREGLRRSGDDRYRQALAQVYVTWSENVGELDRRFELLQQALAMTPDDPFVLQRLTPYAAKTSPRSKEVRAQLNDMLTRGKAQTTAHLILGTIAAEEKRWQQALVHMQQAHAQNPQLPAAVNNLAWVLANIDPPQWQRALELADQAVQLSPQNAAIRETRGSIHVQLGNWQQAVADLELALRAFADRPSIHEGLAKAYHQLGDDQLASRHRQAAGAAADE